MCIRDSDAIVVTVGATRVPMTRVPDGTAPSPTTAPTAAGTATTVVSADPSDPFEACVADYYRCIDQMPASARDASAGAIEATKGIFERARRSPSDRAATLQSCRRAVDLARMTFCPDG